MYLIHGIDVENLFNATKQFELFRKDMIAERDKAGAIQAFEFCYELSWKTMKRIIQVCYGKTLHSPREVFREAAACGLISDPRIWFAFINARNITVHTYDPKIVQDILDIFDDFSLAVSELLQNLERINDLS